MAVEHHKGHDEPLLTRWLGTVYQRIKAPPSRTTWLILAVSLLVVGLVVTWFYVSSTTTDASSALWDQFSRSVSAKDLEDFAKAHPNTVQGRYARAKLARIDMQAVGQVGSPFGRRPALEQIDQGRQIYEKLIDESSDTPALMQEALLGAAKAQEIRGDFDAAKKWLDRLVHEYPKSAEAKVAKDHLDAIADPDKFEEMKALADEYGKTQ